MYLSAKPSRQARSQAGDAAAVGRAVTSVAPSTPAASHGAMVVFIFLRFPGRWSFLVSEGVPPPIGRDCGDRQHPVSNPKSALHACARIVASRPPRRTAAMIVSKPNQNPPPLSALLYAWTKSSLTRPSMKRAWSSADRPANSWSSTAWARRWVSSNSASPASVNRNTRNSRFLARSI